MRGLSNTNKGFTLVEVVSAVLLLTLVFVSFLGGLMAFRYAASYSKHKVQAVYVAQRIIEEERRQPFVSLVSLAYGPVSIDTKGTFNTSADDYMGTALVMVNNIDAYRKKVQVEVDWQERTALGAVTKREYCTTDIANEPQLN